ncbi:MAG: hypothetical protein OXH15_15030 [Gammaproteobacteria bacterium]|nr:hypothetical protein [Gammaproteobacteria bacterium]
MAHFEEFLAVALAEMRAARRLVRTWLFVGLAVLLGGGSYLIYAGIHGVFSGLSSTVGPFSPRVLVSSIGMAMVMVLIIGIVFLGLDVRSRDQRERMAEVLDARPISNLALVAGRLAGVVFILWLVVLVLLMLLQLVGVAAQALDWWVGDTLEPLSMVSFLVWDAIPALTLWGSLTVLLAVVVRNRLFVFVAAFAFLGLYLWAGFETPFDLMRAVGGSQAFQVTGSDVLPDLATVDLVVQRLATLSLAVAFLVLAAAWHPRRDGYSNAKRFALATAFVGIATAGIGYLVLDVTGDRARRAEWAAAHRAVESQPRVDLERIDGRVDIEPGRRLSMDLTYTVAANDPLEELLFGFNPGLEVSELRVNGALAESSHELGLLRVPLASTARPGERFTMEITAMGIPDPSFAYLDSHIDPADAKGAARNLTLLGTEASLFDGRYVALTPGVRWLPLPGPATGNDDPEHYGRDYYAVDLEIDVPDGWLVAGPGLRRDAGDGRFRFAPPVPVPEVALLASVFERRHLTVDGVTFELLLYPGHGDILEPLAGSAGVIEERIGEVLGEARKAGLGYPYEGLSLVEVPASLRVYGGGWRMDSVQAAPGIMMLREYGLPTARFDTLLKFLRQVGHPVGALLARVETGEDPDADRELARAKIGLLGSYFGIDFSGGNLVDGITRSVFRFRTSPRGEGAIALDYLCHELATMLVHHRPVGRYFSPPDFATTQGMDNTLGQFFGGLASGGGSLSISVSSSGNETQPASVWNRALDTPLAKLDPSQGGEEALDVLALKAPALARSMVDGLGRDAVAALIAELRRRHAGSTFTIDDFNAVAKDTGHDLDVLLGDWLHDASLPGFLASDAAVERLVDDEGGEPRYQVRASVHNGEPTPGLVRLGAVGDSDGASTVLGDPIRVDGHASVEMGLVMDEAPDRVWVAPYLSLNRRDIVLELPAYDTTDAVDAEPLNGSRPSDWLPPPAPGIVVDDLDDGFSVVYASPEDEERYGVRSTAWWIETQDIDQGLPVFDMTAPPSPGWTRTEVAGTWGRYRHAAAVAYPGSGGASARFAAELPRAGRWRLDYHVPDVESGQRGPAAGLTIRIQSNSFDQDMGDLEMAIVAADAETPVEFDAAAATAGWNDLGEFTLPAGEVALFVSNRTTGSFVVADAVWWRPVGR